MEHRDLDDLLVETRAYGLEWSVSLRTDDAAVASVEHRPLTLLRTASVAKVFVLMELAGRLASGELDAERLIDRRTTPAVHDSGLWHAMAVDLLPVTDLAVLVGAVSDNWATNALINLCGLDRIRAVAAAAAPGGSALHDHVRNDRSGAVPKTLSLGCAGDWSAIMQRLCYASGPDAAASGRVLDWLARGTDLSMVAAAFDLDPLAHDAEDLGLRLWHKTGSDPGVRADVGLVRAGDRSVSYAVICNWPANDRRPHVRRAALATMRRIGDAIRTDLTRA